MIIVRFFRKDGKPIEEYYYHNIADAFYHLHVFRKDTSNLYDKIEMILYIDGLEETLETIQF